MELIYQCALSIAPSLIVGIFMAIWNKQQKKRDQRSQAQEAARLKSEELRISLLLATSQLSYAVAMALKRGKPNGEIEVGVEQYKAALEKFREFERSQIAKI